MSKCPVGIVFITVQHRSACVGLRRSIRRGARANAIDVVTAEHERKSLPAFIVQRHAAFRSGEDHWALHALHHDAEYGLSSAPISDRDAAIILNLHG
jgi:hypothetical protein